MTQASAQPNKIIILGGKGMLGSRLQHYLSSLPVTAVLVVDRDEVNVCNSAAVKRLFEEEQPNWVINCAAFLNADKCEQEPHESYRVNYRAAVMVAEEVKAYGKAKLIHFSSDFVFDGKQGGYNEEDCALPVSYYGLHKYMADEGIRALNAHAYILRIASVIGAGEVGRDLIKALLGRVATGVAKVGVVEELQISTASTQFIGKVVQAIITARTPPEFGLYNCVADGVTSWHAIAKAAFDALGVNVPVEPIAASAFPTPAARPAKSNLDNSKLKAVLGGDVPDWESMIRAQMQETESSYRRALQPAKAA